MTNEVAREINEKFLELEQLIFENRREITSWGEDLDQLDKIHEKYVTIAGKTGRKKRENPIKDLPFTGTDIRNTVIDIVKPTQIYDKDTIDLPY